MTGTVCAIKIYDGEQPTILINNHILYGGNPKGTERVILNGAVMRNRLVACMSPSLEKGTDGTVLPLEMFAEWLANGEVGLSSLAVVQRLTGVRMTANGHRPEGCECVPHDPDDLRRILLMLDAVPAARAYLNLMRDVSEDWRGLIDHWNEIEDQYHREAPTGRAPKTLAMMRALRKGTANVQL